jgi:hypothetical protein
MWRLLEDGSGKGKTLSVDRRDSCDGKDLSINTTSDGRKKGKGKGLSCGRNTPGLAPQPAGQSAEEDDVAIPKKSGSSALSKQPSPVNTAKSPDSALSPTYSQVSRYSSCKADGTDPTASVPAEVAKTDDMSGGMSKIALGGDQECAEVDRSQPNDSIG